MYNFTKEDMQRMSENILRKINEKTEILNKFWLSPLCLQMIEDIKLANKGFNNEHYLYFPDKVKDTYNWHHISEDNIDLFIQVMSDRDIDSEYTEVIEESEDFDYFTLLKQDLYVSIAYGQGCSISIYTHDEYKSIQEHNGL